MSPVDFKKWPCRPIEFKGQGPHHWSRTKPPGVESLMWPHSMLNERLISDS